MESVNENEYSTDKNGELLMGFKPEVIKGCKFYAQQFYKALTEEAINRSSAEISAEQENEVRRCRAELQTLSKAVSAAEVEFAAWPTEKEKLAKQFHGLNVQERQLYAATARTSKETLDTAKVFQELQDTYSDLLDEYRSTESMAEKMRAKVEGMKKSLAIQQESKQKMSADKARLVKSLTPEIFEQTVAKLDKVESKMASFKAGLRDVKQLLEKEKKEIVANEQQVKINSDQLAHKEAQLKLTATEMNSLKLRIEDRTTEQSQQMTVMEEKLKRVTGFCQGLEATLRAELQKEYDSNHGEVEDILSKNRCLEDTYQQRCEEKREVENGLTKARSEIWQEQERQRERLAQQLEAENDLLYNRKMYLKELKARSHAVNAARPSASPSASQHSQALSNWKRRSSPNNSGIMFKKPFAPKVTTDRDTTNELFQELRRNSLPRERFPRNGTPDPLNDECGSSALSLSSIEGFESLELRLAEADDEIESISTATGPPGKKPRFNGGKHY